MTNNSIPDFLRAHTTKPEQNTLESASEPLTQNLNNFMPVFQENETVESFAATPETDVSNSEESTDTPSTTENPITDDIAEKYKDALKPRLPKGSKPPFLSLGDAVHIIQEIYDRAGGGVSFDAFSRITKNSTASSSFQQKITALRSYSLVTTENKSVILTTIADAIAAPRDPKGKADALKAAFCSIDVFEQIYLKFCGRILPQDEFLINIFKDIVPRDFAPKWMEKFKDSAIFANFLFDRGDGKFQVIEDAVYDDPTTIQEKPEETSPTEDGEQPQQSGYNNTSFVQNTAENAIKTITLKESKKSVWIGTDANMFEIKRGKDLNFVLALIKLFDEYETDKLAVEPTDKV